MVVVARNDEHFLFLIGAFQVAHHVFGLYILVFALGFHGYFAHELTKWWLRTVG